MPKKIFELAKELDVKPLDLVEDLKAKGFNVRNHMSSLSDEEIDKVMAEMKSQEEEKAKTTKKKTKKKKAKKKATKAAAGTAKKKTAKKKKVVTVKKKTVLKKKADEKAAAEEKKEVEAEQISAAAAGKKAETKVASTEAKAESDEKVETVPGELKPTGLRVVKKPKKVEKAEEPAAKAEGEKEYLEEKVHKFTPVYIPEKKEETKGAAAEDEELIEDEDSGDDDKKKGKSKKRLGGLASMMSGKKANINRSEALNKSRADQELKSYAALSSSGRPLYTQVKRKRQYSGPTEQTEITEVKEHKRFVEVFGGAYLDDLAQKLAVKFEEVRDKCLDLNLLVKPTDYVGIDLANKIADMYDYRVEDKSFKEEEVIGKKDLSEKEISKLPLRDPIIAIMGHVDHGKTTLLDYIRKAKVAAGEAGGITQHIGAYTVPVKDKHLTFLDTPGHAAFASMRERGANVTDIVVLVVAADDGVMPQTKESIRFCQQAEVPVIVAVNKMDKEDANPDRVKTELAEFGITPEDWGGDTQFANISALKGEGIDELLESIALQAEIMELRSDPKGQAEGVVIESKVEQGRGPVATLLVQSGTLKKGDSIVVGETFGRARSLMDSLGKQLKKAGPSTPVQVLGLNEAPSPGDSLNVVKNEREAKKIVSNRVAERKELEAAPVKQKISLEDFFAAASEQSAERKTLNLIVRADVQGSYEAIKQSLEPLSNKEVEVKVIGGGVGPISDSDVNLASTGEAFILGFNMRPVTSARKLAEQKGVDVKTYSIIYELINDVKLAIEGLLEPEFTEEFIGRAEVRETFNVPKVGTIAGSAVVDGKIQLGCSIRLLREGKIVFDGKLSSLKRFKEDVKEVKTGYECGIGLEKFNDVKVGDLFEAYTMVKKKRTLEEVEKEESQAAAQPEQSL